MSLRVEGRARRDEDMGKRGKAGAAVVLRTGETPTGPTGEGAPLPSLGVHLSGTRASCEKHRGLCVNAALCPTSCQPRHQADQACANS